MAIRNYRSWKNFSLEDIKEYYNENYEGKSRIEVSKKDRGFYQVVQRRKLLDSIFPKSNSERRSYKGLELKDLKNYYKENYKGKSRSEVSKKDSGFYHAIYNLGLLDKVFPKDKRGKEIKSYKDWKLKDFKNYYKENYQGMAIGEVSKKYKSFYSALYNRDYLDKIIPRKNRDWENYSLYELKKYAKKNFEGLEERFKEYRAFYYAVKRKGLMDKVFSENLKRE